MQLSITLIIVIITSLVSIGGFSNHKIINDLIFYPPAVTQQKQWWRFFTCGLIHADWGHLVLNMYALYIFGVPVEHAFLGIFGEYGAVLYLVMYITALMVCLLPTYGRHRNDHYYRSLGASGAVSAVIFCFILLDPLQKMGLIFLPIMIPGFIFGALYLIASSIMNRRSADNINHSAHIWGAVYGVAFLAVMGKLIAGYPIVENFIQQIQAWSHSF